MQAEIANIEGGAARWQFALGCARVALIPPRRPDASGQVLWAAIRLGAAACAGVACYGGITEPARGIFRSPVLTLLFAALLAGYAGVAYILSQPATTQAKVARQCGLVGGATVGCLLFIATSPINPFGNAGFSNGLGWLSPLLAILPVAVVATWRGRTIWAGVEAGVWTGLVSGLLFCTTLLILTYAATGRFAQDPATIAGIQSQLAWASSGGPAHPDIATYLISANEETAAAYLVTGPLLCLGFGVVGSLIGVGLASMGLAGDPA